MVLPFTARFTHKSSTPLPLAPYSAQITRKIPARNGHYEKPDKIIQLTSWRNQNLFVYLARDIYPMKLPERMAGEPMADIDLLLARAKEFHGDVCPGIVLGTRMTMIGMRELHMDPMVRNRDLIVYVEIDRCITDAVQAITGCSLGRRTLKYRPYGKFAATFIDLATQDAVRVSALEKEQPGSDVATALLDAPEEELFRVQKVRVVIPEGDLPGFPKNRTRCSRCGETILDDKEVVVEETILCSNCARGSYYTETD